MPPFKRHEACLDGELLPGVETSSMELWSALRWGSSAFPALGATPMRGRRARLREIASGDAQSSFKMVPSRSLHWHQVGSIDVVLAVSASELM